MARQKMVTRTITKSLITAIVLNVDTLESAPITFEVSGIYELGTREMKSLLDSRSDETHMYVKATKVEVIEQLYGMTEDEFIQYGRVLPPRTKADAEEE